MAIRTTNTNETNMHTMKNLESKIFKIEYTGELIEILRVPGGWLIRPRDSHSNTINTALTYTFIPFSDEFKIERPK